MSFLIILTLLNQMLAQLPRKSVFPEHIINSIISRIELDVENDVIPVSAGIYSEYKLNEKLQAIPKPIVSDYDDRIFFELADFQRMPCKLNKCVSCGEDYGNKKHIPVQCKFCGVWSCSECICPRKRYHPRARESNSERYEICYRCDDKFLSLILNHSYVENRALLEEAIQRVRQEKQKIEIECDKREQITTVTKDTVAKNKFKISGLKKDKINLNKSLVAMKKEKQDLLFKINIRQKYLSMLKNKKQNQSQIKKVNPLKIQKIDSMMELSTKDEIVQKQNKPLKVVRLMSQTAVVSEAIYQTKQVNQKSIQTHQKQEQKQKTIEQQEQLIIAQPQIEAKVQNFFNFHEWGNQESVVPDIEEKNNNNEEQTFKRSPEQSTNLDSNYPSPTSNLLSQNEQIHQTLAQKRLAEIFSKADTTKVEMQQELSEPESLDADVIDQRKKEIMRAAIQQSHMQRLSLQEDGIPDGSEIKKCACNIY